MRTQYVLLAFFLAATIYGQEAAPKSLESRFDKAVIAYVDGTFFDEHDKNGDGFLDKAEWVNVRWSPSNPPENSDLNGDGKLSREELCIRISKGRGFRVKGEPSDPPDMVMLLKRGQSVQLFKESGRYEVWILSEKDVETRKADDKKNKPFTVKRVNQNYVVLAVPYQDAEQFIAANAISSILVPVVEKPVDEKPAKDTP